MASPASLGPPLVGKYAERDMPDYSGRDWKERTFTVGIGGPVGSGKTALLLALCRALRDDYNIGKSIFHPTLPPTPFPILHRRRQPSLIVRRSWHQPGAQSRRRVLHLAASDCPNIGQ